MTLRESEKYIDLLIAFLRKHTGTTMVLQGIDLWHQELIVVDAKPGSVVANATADESFGESSQVEEDGAQIPQVSRSDEGIWTRGLKGSDTANEGSNAPKNKQTPKVTAMQVTLILRFTFSNLPSSLLGSMASVAIQEHESNLLDLLHEQQAFYTFFKMVDGVESIVIDQVTPAPTDAPTSYAYFIAHQEALLSVEEDASADTGVGIGELYHRPYFRITCATSRTVFNRFSAVYPRLPSQLLMTSCIRGRWRWSFVVLPHSNQRNVSL